MLKSSKALEFEFATPEKNHHDLNMKILAFI